MFLLSHKTSLFMYLNTLNQSFIRLILHRNLLMLMSNFYVQCLNKLWILENLNNYWKGMIFPLRRSHLGTGRAIVLFCLPANGNWNICTSLSPINTYIVLILQNQLAHGVMNRLQTGLLILSKYKRINQLLYLVKLSENQKFSDDFKGNRS